MSRKEARVTPFPTQPAPIAGARIGRMVALDLEGQLTVDLGQGHHPAKLAISIDAERIRQAIEAQQPAVLVFENGDPMRPIVIGLIEPPLAPAIEILANSDPSASPVVEAGPVIEADVDGRRVRLTAKDEIVLECGQASITMRRNGRVVIRGTHVESYSDGTNRIKGGQVRIN